MVEVGDIIYVDGAAFVYRGRDDRAGGKAEVIEVIDGISGGEPAIYVVVKPFPNLRSNWEYLKDRQEELKERFGEQWAHREPDMREEFNPPNDGWPMS